MSRRHFVFILGSSRAGGNSETLARRAASSLPGGTEQSWFDLRQLPLPDFEDRRHGDRAAAAPGSNEQTLLDATLAATDLVIVSPLYWYSVSANVKRYLDYWSGWLRLPGVDFKARMAGRGLWGVSVMSDADPARAEPLVGTLRITADYLRMRWGGVLLGNGSRPGDILADDAALSAAETFFVGHRSTLAG